METTSTLFLPPDIEVEIIEREGILAVEFDGYQIMEGDMPAAIMEAVVMGATSREDVYKELRTDINGDLINRAINQMVAHGFLIEPEGVPGSVICKWRCLPWPLTTIRQALVGTTVGIKSYVSGGSDIKNTLQEWGISINTDTPAIYLVFTDSLSNEALDAFNQARQEDGIPWLLVLIKPELAAATLFIAGETGCWQCLDHALQENLPRINVREKCDHKPEISDIWKQSIGDHIARMIISWCIEDNMPGLNKNLTVWRSVFTPVVHHPIRRVHDCPACGLSPAEVEAYVDYMSILLEEGRRVVKKDDHCDDQHAEWERLISPLTGVIRHTWMLPELHAGIGRVCMVQHRLARSDQSLDAWRINAGARSIGKGHSPEVAWVSGVAEAVERYSGIWRPGLPHVRAAYRELSGSRLHPREMLGFSACQYAVREAWNRDTPYRMLHIPAPYDEIEQIDWVQGWSLTHNRSCWVPAALSFYDHPDRTLGYADSNGCAAGQVIADAILSGLFEIIERDAVAIWWYNQLPRPAIDLDSFKDPALQACIKAHKRQGRELWALDLRMDLPVPVVAAVSKGEGDDWVVGFGCHWEVCRALDSAMLEIGQVLTVRNGAGHPVFTGKASNVGYYMRPNAKQPLLELTDFTGYPGSWPSIGRLVDELEMLNLETIVVDQSHPDVGVPVVRVIVPGMAHHWRRLGRQRLYQLPVKLGAWDERKLESEINPASLVL